VNDQQHVSQPPESAQREAGWSGDSRAGDQPSSTMSARAPWSRRSFIHIAGVGVAVGGLTLTTVGTAAASGDALDTGERDVLLAVARAGAVFPVDFPSYNDETPPAVNRATAPRLGTALSCTSPERVEQARQAARNIIDSGIDLAAQPALLDQLGQMADSGDTATVRGATSLVALAVTTVSTRFDPNDDQTADVWLEGIRILHANGYFRTAR
jgi:hypothetical protein